MADRDPTPQEVWAEACRKAEEYVKAASFEEAGDMAIEVAHELLSVAHQLKGIACCVCNGRGTITYGDTSTWRHAIGGQALTEDVCERCWGTGRADKSGPDLRRIKSLEQQNEHIHLKNKSLALEKIDALEEIERWKEATGLEKGGDPDAVTPDDLEALLAEHEAEMAKVCLVIEQFCRQCEYRPDPGSCSDCPLQPYGYRKMKQNNDRCFSRLYKRKS